MSLPIISLYQLEEPQGVMETLSTLFSARGLRTANLDLLQSGKSSDADLLLTSKKHDFKDTINLSDTGVFPFRYYNEEFLKNDFEHIYNQILTCWLEKPLYCCILIGGKSSRMGQPKHLIKGCDEKTWLERTAELASALVDKVVLSGRGDIPVSLQHLDRIADVEGVGGPLSGVMACFRSHPEASWLVLACDMPLVTEDSISWLLSKRRLNRWGVVPNSDGPEPLFACYENVCKQMFEQLVTEQKLKIRLIVNSPRIYEPIIPEQLLVAWSNINTPESIPTLD
ncbi:MAG: molybdenum cofactor guanylyltransferase [Desulfotalea sp.]